MKNTKSVSCPSCNKVFIYASEKRLLTDIRETAWLATLKTECKHCKESLYVGYSLHKKVYISVSHKGVLESQKRENEVISRLSGGM